jgi:hypothetical protein
MSRPRVNGIVDHDVEPLQSLGQLVAVSPQRGLQ